MNTGEWTHVCSLGRYARLLLLDTGWSKATGVISWYFMVFHGFTVFQLLCVHINSSGIPSGLDSVLMCDLCRNEWRPPTVAQATAAGHQEEVLRATVIPVTVKDAWAIVQCL